MKISYGITVHNEAEELQKLLDILVNKIDDEDEIVICVDGNDNDVKGIVDKYSIDSRVVDYKRKLDGNFAEHKNSVIEKSTGDYIFHIDADEYPHKLLLLQIKRIIEMNDNVDLIWIPRVNTVDGIASKLASNLA
jgi:glycosyltransferase involved in cell wall biosynthesis